MGARKTQPLPLLTHQPSFLLLPVPFFLCLALVYILLTCCGPDQELGLAFLIEIELERDNGSPFALGLTNKVSDFALFQQKFARTFRQVIELRRWRINRNIRIDQPSFIAFYRDIAFRNIGFALS